MILNLFDGGAVGGAPAGTASEGGETTTSTPESSPAGFKSRKQAAAERERMAREAIKGNSQPIKAVEPTVEKAVEEPKEDKVTEEKPIEDAPIDYAAKFEELMEQPDFRKEFSKKAQTIIDQRFKELKGYQSKLEALEPVIMALNEKYGVSGDNVEDLVKAFRSDMDL